MWRHVLSGSERKNDLISTEIKKQNVSINPQNCVLNELKRITRTF
jgi:hypothetical protein